MTDNLYYFLNKERDKIASILSGEDICKAMNNGNIHFNGHKPWKKYSINFDVWWELLSKIHLSSMKDFISTTFIID